MIDERLASQINSKIDDFLTQVAQDTQAKAAALKRAKDDASVVARTFVEQVEPLGRQTFSQLSAKKLGQIGDRRNVRRLRDTSGLPSTVEPFKFGPFTDRHRYLHQFGLLSSDYELRYRQGRLEEMRGHGDVDTPLLPPPTVTPDASGMCRWYDESGLRETAITEWSYGSVADSLDAVRSRGRDLPCTSTDAAILFLDTDTGQTYIAWNYDRLRGVVVSVRVDFEEVPQVGSQIAAHTWIESVDEYLARIVACELAIDEFRQTRYRR
ncbi:hypothetical protein [Gordonia westfalica]|uniref:Uncharacterized protein n=1 Tax=Gordonia westfalica TaxID=158898 RepID=A0A1H2JSP1_9ACTN|nr:hypothetical protein [Gordonia westfalica]SDU59559.1 hypothetical protein SAMN04488548_1342477 [Gordonia westfalica]